MELLKTTCHDCSKTKVVKSEVIEIITWKGIPAIELKLSCGHGIFIKVAEVTNETYEQRALRIKKEN